MVPILVRKWLKRSKCKSETCRFKILYISLCLMENLTSSEGNKVEKQNKYKIHLDMQYTENHKTTKEYLKC